MQLKSRTKKFQNEIQPEMCNRLNLTRLRSIHTIMSFLNNTRQYKTLNDKYSRLRLRLVAKKRGNRLRNRLLTPNTISLSKAFTLKLK